MGEDSRDRVLGDRVQKGSHCSFLGEDEEKLSP